MNKYKSAKLPKKRFYFQLGKRSHQGGRSLTFNIPKSSHVTVLYKFTIKHKNEQQASE